MSWKQSTAHTTGPHFKATAATHIDAAVADGLLVGGLRCDEVDHTAVACTAAANKSHAPNQQHHLPEDQKGS